MRTPLVEEGMGMGTANSTVPMPMPSSTNGVRMIDTTGNQ